MEKTLERKRHYIELITQAHSLYLPDSAIAVKAAKALERLPEQALFYLSHLAPKKTGAPGDEPVFLPTREDIINYARGMGMPEEAVFDDVIQLVRKKLNAIYWALKN